MPRRKSHGIIELEHDRARLDVSVKVLALSNCATGPVFPLVGARLAARGEGSGRGGVAAGRAGDARGNGEGRESRGAPLRRGCGPAELTVEESDFLDEDARGFYGVLDHVGVVDEPSIIAGDVQGIERLSNSRNSFPLRATKCFCNAFR